MRTDPNKQSLEKIINDFNNGNTDNALSEIKEIVKNFPNSPLSHNILGSIQMTLDDFNGAQSSFEKAMYLKKDYVHAINNLGLVFYKIENFEKAIFYFKKASLLDKNYEAPLLNLSAVYTDTFRFNEAKNILNKILSLNPNKHEAFYNLANLYTKSGEADLAIENLNKAISIDKTQLNYLKDLGNIYLQKGEYDIGIKYLEEYLKLFPNSTEVYFYVSLIKSYKKSDKFFKSMFHINEDELPDRKKVFLFFTYGKIFGDLQDYKKSFFYYQKVNSLKVKMQKFDFENVNKLLPMLKKQFSTIKLNNVIVNDEILLKKSNPIFIVGMPRSGTSLIDQILSKHTDIKALGELEYLGNEINNLNLFSTNFSKEKANLLNINYYKNLNNESLQTKFFTDKTPLNFRWIGYIVHSFPNAKIIHIQRDAQATCWSNFKSNFSGRANDFSNNLENTVGYFINYKNIMSFYNDLFKHKILNITYENLVNDFENCVKKIISYLELKWDDNCLHFYEGDRFISTTSFAQVKRKLFYNSSTQWKKYESFLNKYFKILE